MFTATALTEQLAACERQIVAIRLKAEEKKLEEEERYKQVCAKREECAASHKEKVDELVSEYGGQLEATVAQAEREIADIHEKRDKALQRSADAQARTAALNAEAKALEREVRSLCGRIDMQEADYERQTLEVQQEADDHVRHLLEDCSSRVLGVSTHAADVQDRTLDSIASLQQEAKSRVISAVDQSRQRSRFENLVVKISQHTSQDLTKEQLVQAKTELLQAWLDDWVGNMSGQTSETPSYLTEVLTATVSAGWNRTRSVDRQMEAATLRQRDLANNMGCGLVSGWGEFRPQTAP
mmetsp:Transcript_52763/g.152100  ORF Transcript_52763/g.152100 Transcript_52763/m.152100 type:complete len:297 (+) Transcript_52763:92-982(+)